MATYEQTFGQAKQNSIEVNEYGEHHVKVLIVGRGHAVTLDPDRLRHHIAECEEALAKLERARETPTKLIDTFDDA